MFLTRRLAAFMPIIAALAIAAPVAAAGAASADVAKPVVTGPSCPANYAGPTNLATGCPYWLMTYTVQYPGQPPRHCPVTASQPPGLPSAGSGTMLDPCIGVAATS